MNKQKINKYKKKEVRMLFHLFCSSYLPCFIAPASHHFSFPYPLGVLPHKQKGPSLGLVPKIVSHISFLPISLQL